VVSLQHVSERAPSLEHACQNSATLAHHGTISPKSFKVTWVYYFDPVGVQSIVINVYVCLFACLFVDSHIKQEAPLRQTDRAMRYVS